MDIVRYEKKLKNIWDEFVLNAKNATIFHTQTFLSYHKNKFKDASIMIYDKNKLIALFPAIDDEDKIISHKGSTYGGLIVSKKNTLKKSLEIWEEILKFYKKDIEFRKNEYIFDIYPSEEVLFAAKKVGFKEVFSELSTCLDLSFIKFSHGRKEAIKKCKSLKIIFDDLNYNSYYSILSKNLEKFSAVPTHTLEEMILLKKLLPKNYYLVSIYYKDKMIAGIWLVIANKKTAHTFYIAQDYEFKKFQPLSCVIKYIIKFLQKNGFSYLNFGISTENKGEIINYGLFEFKESFGGFGVERKYFKVTL